MSHTRSYESLILISRDVGEADRFLILFTREGGKRTARAKGVRKPSSRLGGLLLPMRHLQLELRDSGESAIVTGAVDIDAEAGSNQHFLSFARLNEGVELLLRLIEDDEPLPEVFDLLLQFRSACTNELPEPVLPFQLSLFHHLGLLPTTDEDLRFAKLSDIAKAYVRSCRGQ